MDALNSWAEGLSQRCARALASGSIKRAMGSAAPPLIFGLRLAASVSIALYIAFLLQLDNAYWAAASAAAVSQPSLGASLRQGWFRMVGTLVGAAFIVILTACFVQNRAAFLIGLALWCSACALIATLLRNFASYAGALAGYTAVIVASDELGATGGASHDVFMFAVTRVSEICIGIVCAGVVLAATDFGGARRRLAAVLAGLAEQIMGRFVGTLATAGPDRPDTQPVRREFIRRIIALDPAIDQAIGESSQLRQNSPSLRQAVYGLIGALAGWRTVACHLAQLSHRRLPQPDVDTVLQMIPGELRMTHVRGSPTHWIGNPGALLRICQKAIRTLIGAQVHTPSAQLFVDQTVMVLSGISRALQGLALLVAYPANPRRPYARLRLDVPDWLPPLLNAGRAFLAIGVAELFWVLSGWPSGATCIVWTAITVVLFGPQSDQAYSGAVKFLVGTAVAVAFAALFKFAVLPQLGTFAGLSVALACYLIPIGALSSLGWHAAVFMAMPVNFVALLTPENATSYDTVQFYNSSLALFAGSAIAVLAFRVLPPVAPVVRTRRLLKLTLRDLRRLARDPIPHQCEDFEHRIFARISALPDSAEPLQRAQIVAALAVGSEMTRLYRIGRRLGINVHLEAALKAVARGRSASARLQLAQFDQMLAQTPRVGCAMRLALHARGSVLALSEVLIAHAPYLDGETGE